ncbi:hypothetical protein [Tenacibaculum caenipelagi]|uniref:Lipoprotein n=1 Tax=Tenacibaculum caenipelagi TaxID=1325435 RepID=A0A4R6TE99_9FLAO|nr:hypothetical protein [Tenacibaculum caenipelagi]TDQ22783.1 hypothetical protein DFQ07_2801 [Tenacibaculum caenipelagi]
MKKKTLVVALIATFAIACTNDMDNLIEPGNKIEKEIEKEIENEKQSKIQLEEPEIDPEKDCPQNDRNCNGIPDSQE